MKSNVITEIKNIKLREGLEKFYVECESLLSNDTEGISNELKSFLISHDVAHVLFGCDISLLGEGSVKIWTLFGTTLGFWNAIRAYKKANAYALAKNFNFTHVVNNIFKFLSSIPILIVRANRMHKPWPWTEFESYLDTPISEIRKEFNIHVL